MHLYLSVLMSLILDRHFQNFYCVFMIGVQDPPHFSDIKSVIYSQMDSLDLNLGCQGFVIQSENATASIVKQLEHQMLSNSISRFNRRRYLFISNSLDILNLTQLDQVKDVLLIRLESQRYELLTRMFASGEPSLVDVWFPENQTFLHNAPLYPEIIDFQGRTLQVSSFTYVPYNVLVLGDSFETSGGIEITLLSEFIKKLNLTAVLKNKAKEQWGHEYENGTGYGMIGDIATQRSDIATSDIFIRHRSTRTDISTVVLITRMFCLVPKPKLIINFLTPFSQFTPELWGLYFLFIAFSILVVFFFIHKMRSLVVNQRNPLFMETTYNVLGLFLLQPVQTETHFRHVRSLFLSLFLLVLIMSNLYNSGLASRMVVPSYGDEINTLWDMAKSNLPWGTTDKNLWTSVIETEDREPYKTIVSNFQEHNETELKIRRLSGDFGFPIEKLPSGYYAMQDFMDEVILEKVQPMKEELYWAYTVFLVRKNFVLLSVLDDFILRAHQYGLVLKWEQKALESSNLRLQSILKSTKEKRTHEKLAWIHIQGVLVIWIGGITLSILCFICEVFKKVDLL